MKKPDVITMILVAIAAQYPDLALNVTGVAGGIDHLIHKDDDPSNDLDETADAITEIVLSVVGGIEHATGHDYVNDPVLAQVAANLKGDIKMLQLVRVKKAA